MDIHTLLSQAPERLRAYWRSDDIDQGRVGWRTEPTLCPIAEWLDYEQACSDCRALYFPLVQPEEIVFNDRLIATPPVLAYFIDLIDSARMVDRWLAATGRITIEEA